MTKWMLFCASWLAISTSQSQWSDEQFDHAEALFEEALGHGESYERLRELTKDIGHRLSGSSQADEAMTSGARVLRENGADSVYVMPVEVPAWTRGTICTAFVDEQPLHVTALGGAVPSPGDSALRATCVVVRGIEELSELPRSATEGRVVLFNRPMNPVLINTGAAYGGAVDQRGRGAVAAPKAGGVAALVRSMTHAHDDGAGIVHTLEALRLLRAIGYQPRHTLHFVLFINEENGNRGGKAYAAWAADNSEGCQVVGAMESDAGGFVPRGFSIDADPEHLDWLQNQLSALEPYGLGSYRSGGARVDISPLKENEPRPLLMGLRPDGQRYFDFHHSERDVFENVHKRELELGAASCALMIMLMDQHL